MLNNIIAVSKMIEFPNIRASTQFEVYFIDKLHFFLFHLIKKYLMSHQLVVHKKWCMYFHN
ncbi:hypothetical protein C2G38_2097465 [Gigaspora rosea]|uniref:Uncharacterized protein n=1 Tax=Gigaspora rosea TaxID=44941 RepID=A0A397UYH8_9GLOM|nr:hypothetical protein C2G38_2097465 [Gigaspora rosea]